MHQPEGVLAVGISEAARKLGLSARTVATLIKTGELESRKVGRRRLIPLSVLLEFIKCDHRSRRIGTEETLQGSGSTG
jgi:excisionase family DNA binding protein